MAGHANPSFKQTIGWDYDKIVYLYLYCLAHAQARRAKSLIILRGPRRAIRHVHKRHFPAEGVEPGPGSPIGNYYCNVDKSVVLRASTITFHFVIIELGIVHLVVGLGKDF